MPYILLFETEYSLEFVYTNLPFLSRPSDTKIQTAITWCLQQQKSQKFENVRLWTSIFRYENLKIVSLITSELFNRNLSIVHPTLFFNSVIAPWANTGTGLIRESNDVKLLGITIDRDLKFDKHVLKLCNKANQKLSAALSRVANLLSFNKRRTFFKAFVESPFRYCPIVWMFHS